MASINDVLGTDLMHRSDLVASQIGDLQVLSGLDNVRLALLHRLVTTPGSLVYRPTYGVGIKDYQNAPSSLPLQQQLARRIREQFLQDARVQDVLGVRIQTSDSNPSLVILAVRVKLVGYNETILQFQPFGAS